MSSTVGSGTASATAILLPWRVVLVESRYVGQMDEKPSL